MTFHLSMRKGVGSDPMLTFCLVVFLSLLRENKVKIFRGDLLAEKLESEKAKITQLYLLFFFFLLFPLILNPFALPIFSIKLTFFRLLVIVLIFLLLAKFKDGHSSLKATLFLKPWLFLWIVSVLTFIFSVNYKTAFFGDYNRYEGFFTLTFYFLFFLVFTQLTLDSESLRLLCRGLFFGGILTSLVAWWEHFFYSPALYLFSLLQTGLPYFASTDRVLSTYGNAAYYATYLLFVLPTTLAFSSSREVPKGGRALALATLFLTYSALIFTFTRSAFVGLFLGLAFLWFFLPASSKKTSLSLVVVASVAIFFLTRVPSTSPFVPEKRFTQLVELEKGTSGGNRLIMWRLALPLVQKKPLLGSGQDTFRYIFPRSPESLWGRSFKSALLDKAHNQVIQQATTQGLLYLLAFWWLFILAFLKGLRKLQTAWHESPLFFLILGGALASLLAFQFEQQVLFSHYSYSPFYWAFLGLVFSLTADRNRKFTFSVESGQKILTCLVATCLVGAALLSVSLYTADVLYYQGMFLKGQGRLEEAARKLEKATSLNPFEGVYWLLQGETHLKLYEVTGEVSWLRAAQQSFNQAQKINPLNETQYYRMASGFVQAAQARRQLDLAKKAVDLALKATKINPYSAIHWQELGNAYGTRGALAGSFYEKKSFFQKAVAAYKKALEFDQENDELYYNLGWAYEKLGLKSEAMAAYRECLEINPAYGAARQSLEELTKK